MSATTGSRAGLRLRDLDLDGTVAAFHARSWHGAVHGTVPVLAGSVAVDAAGRPAAVVADLDIAALSSGNPRRDKDLRGKRFLDTGSRPTMRFESLTVAETASGWDVDGVLSISGAEYRMTLRVIPDGAPDAFVATVSLDPRDLGVRAPRFLVRRQVTLTIRTRLHP